MNSDIKKHHRRRLTIQLLWAAATNAWVSGFFTGKIYTGALKNICVPGLNCYSCPGALFACPIGSLQAVMGSRRFSLSFYVIGLLFVFGAVSGRFVCGFLCPFGLFQDLLHKIPFVKKITTFPGDRLLRKLKYGILAVFVILLPLFAVDAVGSGAPAFCKYICPQGTLQAGIPLVLTNGLTGLLGWLYAMKISILVAVILVSLIISRPFCKYLCPLGAFYSFFNKISLFRVGFPGRKSGRPEPGAENHDATGAFGKNRWKTAAKDTDFGSSTTVCPMWLAPRLTPADPECIRCGNCAKQSAASKRTAPPAS